MIPESDITTIKTGTKALILIKSTNKTIEGFVSEVSSSTKNTGGQYLVKVIIDKTDEKLLSGMFTSVQFPVEKVETSSLVIIPKSALIKQGQLTGIYTIGNKNTAILRWLRVGKSFGDQVEVLSGLSANEQYIVSAEGKLYNGAKVSIQ